MSSEEAAPVGSAMQWLEDDLRQTKAQLAKLQQQVEQLQGHLWRATEEAQRTQEAVIAFRSQLGALTSLQEQVRQLTNEAALLKGEQAAIRTALDSARHQWQAAAEKERQEWGQALRRLEAMAKIAAAAEQRFASLEEGQRLQRNEVVPLQQGLAQVERNLDEFKARAARNLEASKHLEQGLERIDRDLDALHKQDDVIMERLHLYTEQVRRLDERLSSVMADQTTHDDIFNKVELVRTEGQHLGERLAALEKAMDGQQGTADDLARSLDLLATKLQGQAERLAELQHQVGVYHQELLTHLHRWGQLQEKQQRRQLSHLEQELRELKQYDLKLNAE